MNIEFPLQKMVEKVAVGIYIYNKKQAFVYYGTHEYEFFFFFFAFRSIIGFVKKGEPGGKRKIYPQGFFTGKAIYDASHYGRGVAEA